MESFKKAGFLIFIEMFELFGKKSTIWILYYIMALAIIVGTTINPLLFVLVLPPLIALILIHLWYLYNMESLIRGGSIQMPELDTKPRI